MHYLVTHRLLIVLIICFTCISASSQNNRLKTHERIGWYNVFTNTKLNKRWSLHGEYQWRRADYLTEWQQSLLRVGINYHINPRVLLRLGYAWVETFPYGSIPINGLGRDFTEHRIYEMVQLSHREERFEFIHRFMLEQRLVGRYSSAAVTKEDEYPLLHRARYLFRMQVPLKGKEINDKTPYLAAYDELFVGFGKNVNANVFDQNRIGILLGYRFSKTFRLEGGYLNQTVQFGRQISGKNVFQHNNGFALNGYLNLSMARN